MTINPKEQKRNRERAAKLKRPSPQELPSGMWRCMVSVNGQRVSVVDSDPETAHARALALKAGLIEAAQEDTDRRKGNITLSDAIERYIEDRANVLSPSTKNGYMEIRRNRFHPLMQKPVSCIEPVDIQRAINEDAKQVGAKTLRNAVGLVSSVLSEYKDINLSKLKFPQRRRKEHAYLTELDIINFLDAIKGTPAEIPLLLGVWLGMRRSEIMGLCWDCIDLEAGKIAVKRTYVQSPDGGYVLRDEMKTEASRRTLDCPGYILEKLKRYTPEHREGRVFLMHPSTLYKNMKQLCEANGIPFVGVHGLRHTNASVMLSLGVVDKVAMARGGWSTDVTMRQVYQHVFEQDKTKAGGLVDGFFQSLLDESVHENAHGKTET